MKYLKIFIPIILLAITFYYCSTVPITGRSQLHLISSADLNALSFQQYNEFLALCKTRHPLVQSGVFGALMGVRLLNDGPVTILLDSRRLF